MALSIAFEVPETDQSPRPSCGRPIDLVHLACQTGGDKVLEMEVLELFARQVRQAACRMSKLKGAERAKLAHMILGSARGVGAFELARCAERIEAKPSNAAALADFGAAVADADNFILGLAR